MVLFEARSSTNKSRNKERNSTREHKKKKKKKREKTHSNNVPSIYRHKPLAWKKERETINFSPVSSAFTQLLFR